MKKERGATFSVVVSFLMSSGSLFAHHSEAMLDKDHLVTLRGIVTWHDFINLIN